MKKLFVLFPVFILVLMLAFSTGCDLFGGDDEDDDLSMWILDQMSGNCATIMKNTSTGDYSATGKLTPKGFCRAPGNGEMRITTDSSVAKTWSDEYYNEQIALFSANKNARAALSGCESIVTNYEAAKEAVTTTTIENAANIGFFMDISIKCIFAQSGYFCISQDEATELKDFFSPSIPGPSTIEYKYHPVNDVRIDMATSFQSLKDTASGNQGATGFTNEQIDNGTLFSYNDNEIYNNFFGPWSTITFNSNTACGTSFLGKHIAFRNVLVRKEGNTLSAYGITADDTAAVIAPILGSWAPLLGSWVQCGYGPGFTATSTVGQCPDTYPTW